MSHLDICRMLADLDCEEHITQQDNAAEKQPKECRYYNIKTVNSADVTARRIEEKKED